METSSGSTVQPLRRAGSMTIRRSSPSLGGPTSNWASSRRSASGRDDVSAPSWSARATTTTRTSMAGSRTRSSKRPATASISPDASTSSNWSTTSSCGPGSSRRATPSIAASGSGPGTITAVRHGPSPGSCPLCTSGIRPALTSDDLPLPDAPTTATSRRSSTRAASSATSSSRPTKRSASAGS